MVQLGWKAGPEQYGPVELLEYAVAAEKAGFDLLDVSDHFHLRPGSAHSRGLGWVQRQYAQVRYRWDRG